MLNLILNVLQFLVFFSYLVFQMAVQAKRIAGRLNCLRALIQFLRFSCNYLI